MRAVIDDPSTGRRFDGYRGIRDYIEHYFIDYHTVARLLSLEPSATTKLAYGSISLATSVMWLSSR